MPQHPIAGQRCRPQQRSVFQLLKFKKIKKSKKTYKLLNNTYKLAYELSAELMKTTIDIQP